MTLSVTGLATQLNAKVDFVVCPSAPSDINFETLIPKKKKNPRLTPLYRGTATLA